VTYTQTVVAVRPEKSEPKRVRITAGGNRLDYHGETSIETASLEAPKLLINSVLSTLKEFQYLRFHISMILQEIIDEYNLEDIMAADGWCYVKIRKAINGLKESGLLANQELKTLLAKEGHILSKFTPGLYTYLNRIFASDLKESNIHVGLDYLV
jgi:hypothetical protein